MDHVRLLELIEKMESETATEAELRELDALYEAFESRENYISGLDAQERALFGERMFERISAETIPDSLQRQASVHKLWPRIAAAASVLLFLSFGGYFIFHKKQLQKQTAQNQPGDIKPGSQKAILQLSNGKKISLTDARAGTLAKQGNATITKSAAGLVVYKSNNTTGAPAAEVFNTITTPRAGFYPLQLSDGTTVILDAASSIKYPVPFNPKERIVEITGQAYFTVARDAAHPFMVKVKGQTIRDIGTQFNINAYDDEPGIRTTLVEGSVSVSDGHQPIVLKPGQQAFAQEGQNDLKVQSVAVDDVIAWKNGQTSFQDEDIRQIMRQVSRWYDVDISYEGSIPDKHFEGGISRKSNLSSVLRILELNNIHFKVDGRKITALP